MPLVMQRSGHALRRPPNESTTHCGDVEVSGLKAALDEGLDRGATRARSTTRAKAKALTDRGHADVVVGLPGRRNVAALEAGKRLAGHVRGDDLPHDRCPGAGDESGPGRGAVARWVAQARLGCGSRPASTGRTMMSADDPLTVSLDSTLVTSHSDEEQPALTRDGVGIPGHTLLR